MTTTSLTPLVKSHKLINKDVFFTIGECGVLAHDGVLTSPLYPNRYPNNMSCTWQIVQAPGRRIGVEITNSQFEFEFKDKVSGKNFCQNDYLEVCYILQFESPIHFSADQFFLYFVYFIAFGYFTLFTPVNPSQILGGTIKHTNSYFY